MQLVLADIAEDLLHGWTPGRLGSGLVGRGGGDGDGRHEQQDEQAHDTSHGVGLDSRADWQKGARDDRRTGAAKLSDEREAVGVIRAITAWTEFISTSLLGGTRADDLKRLAGGRWQCRGTESIIDPL